jgi:hypothetical protein
MKTLRLVGLIGDVVFILWILRNGIEAGFSDIGNIHGIIPLVLALLLALNFVLLYKRK